MKKLLTILILTTALAFGLSAIAQVPKASTKVEVKKVEVKAGEKTVVKVDPEPAQSQPVVVSTKTEAPIKSTETVSLDTATTTTIGWGKVILQHVLELIFSILGIMATILVTILMKKYGFENYSNKINEILLKGTGLAEQKSIQALKLNGTPLGSAEKLAVALDYVTAKAKEYGLPDKGKSWWADKVEGWLGAKVLSNGTVKIAP